MFRWNTDAPECLRWLCACIGECLAGVLQLEWSGVRDRRGMGDWGRMGIEEIPLTPFFSPLPTPLPFFPHLSSTQLHCLSTPSLLSLPPSSPSLPPSLPSLSFLYFHLSFNIKLLLNKPKTSKVQLFRCNIWKPWKWDCWCLTTDWFCVIGGIPCRRLSRCFGGWHNSGNWWLVTQRGRPRTGFC